MVTRCCGQRLPQLADGDGKLTLRENMLYVLCDELQEELLLSPTGSANLKRTSSAAR